MVFVSENPTYMDDDWFFFLFQDTTTWENPTVMAMAKPVVTAYPSWDYDGSMLRKI